MKRIATAISMMLLMLVAASARGQSFNPTPPPEVKKWDVWVGNWALSGMATDTPTGHEYTRWTGIFTNTGYRAGFSCKSSKLGKATARNCT